MNRMNMRTIVIIAVLVIISAISGVSSANDGRFYEEGGLIIPVKEEKISIEKEILTLTFLEDVEKWRVDVYFEFYNPGEALELEVGFVGAIENDFENTPKTPAQGGFENFTVLVNDAPVSLNGATMDYAMTGSEADLQKLGPASLALLRNAIYAYYGYPFANRQYREFFANHYFYERDEQFSEAKIPEEVKRRIEMIKALEKKSSG